MEVLQSDGQKTSSDPGLYRNQAVYLSRMGMIRPGLQEDDGHPRPGHCRNKPLYNKHINE